MNQTGQRRGMPTREDSADEPADVSRSEEQENQQAEGRQSVGGRTGRSRAELITLAASASIVFGLLVVITSLYFTGGSSGVSIEVTPEVTEVTERSGNFYLPLTIANDGDATAEDVIVEVSLEASAGQPEVSEVTIDFLAGNATEDAVVVFSEDPALGDLKVDVISYLSP